MTSTNQYDPDDPLALAQLIVDYETRPVHALFAVESYVDDATGWVLECRFDERGYGTPLTWTSAAGAEQWIKDGCEESGCYGDSRVVGFVLAVRDEPPVRCGCCGKWGHDEASCASDAEHACVNAAPFADLLEPLRQDGDAGA